MSPARALAPATILLLSLLLAADLTADVPAPQPVMAVYVTVDGARDELGVVVHIGGSDRALEAEVSRALLEVLDRVPGSFGMTRNGSGSFLWVSIRGLLRYIASDRDLFMAYMDYPIPSNSSSTCLSTLGRTGFDLGLLIPEELRKIVEAVGASNVVFRIVSPYLNESALREAAQHISGQVTVNGNTLVITLDNASAHACIPYEDRFWKLFGVPRAVATIPVHSPDKYEVHDLVPLQVEVGRVPLRNITAVYAPPPGAGALLRRSVGDSALPQ